MWAEGQKRAAGNMEVKEVNTEFFGGGGIALISKNGSLNLNRAVSSWADSEILLKVSLY